MNDSSADNSPLAINSQDEKPTAAAVKPQVSRARRIYGYTCNLMATAIVLFAAVTFGRQVMSWWTVNEPRLQPAQENLNGLDPAGLTSGNAPLELEIGDWPATLVRAEFTGDTRAAQKELRQLCQASLQQATFPTQPAGPAELKLLSSLEAQNPLAKLPGGWELYEQSGPIPLIAAVGTLPKASQKPSGPLKSGLSTGGKVATAARRVVSWGLGVHLTGTRWTLLLLTARARSNNQVLARPSLPLPPNAKRVLSLAVAQQESIVSFSGTGPMEDWQTFYDQHFSSTDTSASGAWRQLGNVWQRRYESPSALIEIQMGISPESVEIQGLLTILNKQEAKEKDTIIPR